MATHSAKLNDRWSNTKKNFKDFLNEQLRNKMEEIKVKKAHKLDNGNDPSPWLIKRKEHQATFEKGTGYIINEDFLKETLAIRGEKWKKVKRLRGKVK